MGGYEVRRWTAAIAPLLVMVAALPGSGPIREPEPPRAPTTQAPDQAGAAATARTQGTRVEVLDQWTETRTVYAEPDGTHSVELATRPLRVRRGDAWADVDTTLARRPDGSVGPRVASVELLFSGGGEADPMVAYGDGEGRWISLWWPGSLPAPRLNGDTATYHDVRPGVDLVLRAHVDGYDQHLVVKDRNAADDPVVRELRLGLRTDGVTLRTTEAGGLAGWEPGGDVVFQAPASIMWDSGTPRRLGEVGVSVTDRALVLRPDRRLLADEAVRFPVTVDPGWRTVDKSGWTSVLSGTPDTSYWNSSGDPPWAQVGQCYTGDGQCNGIGEAWSYFQYDTAFLSGKHVLEAWLDTSIVHGPQCNTRDHELYVAERAIGPGTNWRNRPQGALLHRMAVPSAYARGGCGEWKNVAFHATGGVRPGGVSTFFLKAWNSGDQLAWRKYDAGATRLRIRFNTVPNVPAILPTSPPLAQPCTHCGGVPYTGDPELRLRAQLSDPDNDPLQPLWRWSVDGVWQEARGNAKPSGEPHDHPLAFGNRRAGHVTWHVKAEDGAHGSGWANGPSFVLDREPPAAEPAVSGVLYQEDNRWHGGVGVPGRFTFGSAGVADIDHFVYGLSDPPTTKVAADRLGGGAGVTITPPGDGPRTLYVESVDRAGNHSPTREYHFYVRAGSGPIAQWSFDGDTDDQAFLGDRHGWPVGGVSYVPGAVGQALRLGGAGDSVTAPNTVRTDASFSVSAWVRLDSADHARAVVSQDGPAFAGFTLWYRAEDGGRWVFGMPRSGDSYQGTDMAWSAQPARTGVWTHLAGVYDAGARSLTLYVNGVRSGTATRAVADWHAAGHVQIGRTMWNGQSGTDAWAGLIDEVKVYDRVVTDAEIRAAVGSDDVAAGHWRFEELAGTTARNAVEGGEAAVLHGDAALTGDSDGDGVADGGIVGGSIRLDGDGDEVRTGGPVLETDQSFAVSTWVQLDRAPPPSQPFTAVSQDGNYFSGFFLGYRQLDTGGVWEFYLPSMDSPTRPADAVVRSTVPARLHTPTHLAAVYDAPAREIRIYVDGLPAGTASVGNGSFDANGPLVVGRGLASAVSSSTNPPIVTHPLHFWPGMVDEVRAYNRELSTAELQGIVSRDDVALGEWRLDGNAADSSGNGRAGTVTGTVQWTGGQTDVPDSTDLAVRLDQAAGHLTMPGTVDVSRSFSVAAWARPDSASGARTVLSRDDSLGSAMELRATADGRWSFRMTNRFPVTSVEVSGGAAQAGVWTHLVAGYDAAARRIYLYVNGVLAGTAAHTQVLDTRPGAVGLRIGTAREVGPVAGERLVDGFAGAIDDVVVYGRVLFAGEIRAMAGRDLTLAHSWPLDEGGGSSAGDAVGRRTAVLAGGVTRVPGRVGNAVRLDGADDRVATAGVDVRTDASFTVTAWVRLGETCAPRDGEFACHLVAVSLDGRQDAATTSKFRLGHMADRGQFRSGVWFFEMPESEAPGAPVTKAAVSLLPSDLNSWVHLAGVYDKPSQRLWLYVNGERKGDGTLNSAWHADGGLQIGCGRGATGAPAQFLPGTVDDVRVYSGPLDDERIGNLYRSYPDNAGTPSLPGAGAGHWRFDENAGTTAADSSGRGLTATLRNGAGWGGGRTGPSMHLGAAGGYAETAVPVVDTTRSFSVTAWVYRMAGGSGDEVVVSQDGGQVSGFQLRYHRAGNRWEAVVPGADATTATLARLTSTEAARGAQWTHLGLVYDASLRQLRLFVNGRLSAAQVGVTTWPASGPLAIGRGKGIGGFFSGAVDDLRAYGKPLSAGELARVYHDAATQVYGSWVFDDQTVRDWSWRSNPTTGSGTVSYGDGQVVGKALVLDGRTTALTTQQVGAPPMDSLTVSAWVRLTHEPAVQTVLAQDGTRMSTYALQYLPSLDRWVFSATTQDADGAESVYAASGRAAVLGRWTHLTGVYDHAAGQLRLYVDGELAGSRDGVTLWYADRGFTIGRGLVNGQPAQFFTGAVDEVHVATGVVPDDEIARRAAFPAPPPGQIGRFVGAGDHYTASTSDPVRPGYRFEGPLGLPVPDGAHTRMLHGCRADGDLFTSTDPGCEGATRVGEVGRVYTRPPTNLPTVAIYRCTAGTDRFESPDPGCEGQASEPLLLGYSLPYAVIARYLSLTRLDHWSTVGYLPPGYHYEGPHGYVSLVPQPGTRPILSCLDGIDQFNSLDPACEGAQVRAELAQVWATPPPGLASRPIYRCGAGEQRYTSNRQECEGDPLDRALGYVLSAVPEVTPEFA